GSPWHAATRVRTVRAGPVPRAPDPGHRAEVPGPPWSGSRAQARPPPGPRTRADRAAAASRATGPGSRLPGSQREDLLAGAKQVASHGRGGDALQRCDLVAGQPADLEQQKAVSPLRIELIDQLVEAHLLLHALEALVLRCCGGHDL